MILQNTNTKVNLEMYTFFIKFGTFFERMKKLNFFVSYPIFAENDYFLSGTN